MRQNARSVAPIGSHMANFPDQETDNPNHADDRNFYKLEKWTKDGTKVDRLLYAGNSLEKARDLFGKAIKHRNQTDDPAENKGA
jgi:hypothetical protein